MSFVSGFRAGMGTAGTFSPFGTVDVQQTTREKREYDQYWVRYPQQEKRWRGLYEANGGVLNGLALDLPPIPTAETETVGKSQFSTSRLGHSTINVMGSNPFGTGQLVGVIRLVVSAVKFFASLSAAVQAKMDGDEEAVSEAVEAMGYWAAHFAVGKMETLGLGVVAHCYASGVELEPKRA